MTTEQREAIEYLEDMANNQKDLNKSGYVCASEKIDTVLSLIKEQQEEIVKYKALYERALSDVVKADKIIELMARAFKQDDVRSAEEIKQYFENQAKTSQ